MKFYLFCEIDLNLLVSNYFLHVFSSCTFPNLVAFCKLLFLFSHLSLSLLTRANCLVILIIFSMNLSKNYATRFLYFLTKFSILIIFVLQDYCTKPLARALLSLTNDVPDASSKII